MAIEIYVNKYTYDPPKTHKEYKNKNIKMSSNNKLIFYCPNETIWNLLLQEHSKRLTKIYPI